MRTAKYSRPTVRRLRNGNFLVNHREYLGEIGASVAFQTASFSLNPGLPGTFPWLSRIANSFEEWKPRKMNFLFKTECSDVIVTGSTSTGALGSVVMATEYNPYNGTFGSKAAMENYDGATSGKPSVSQLHKVQTNPHKNPEGIFYVRNASTATTGVADIRLYDLGVFQIAVSGMPNTGGQIGELWCNYSIEFLKPRMPEGLADPDPLMEHYIVATTGGMGYAGATMLPATPFGTSVTSELIPQGNSTLAQTDAPSGVVPIQTGLISGGQSTSTAVVPVLVAQPQIYVLVNGVSTLVTPYTPSGALGATAANTYYFPPGISSGNYLVSYGALYASTGTVTSVTVTTQNCSVFNLAGNNTAARYYNNSTGNTTYNMYEGFVSVWGPNASLTLAFVGGQTGPTYADFYVIAMPDPMN